MARAAVDASLGALELAGSLCGVPYVGAAATILGGIAECCNDVAVHKRKSKAMMVKCVQLLTTLQDQSSRLEGSGLQEHADEVTAVFERIQKRVKTWSKYSLAKSFVKRGEIEEGLERCVSELGTAMDIFQVNAQIALQQSQRDVQDVIRSDNADLRNLLHQILTSQNEMRQIVEMQTAGEHVAEPIMEAGQQVLRNLRESSDQAEEALGVASSSASAPPVPQDGQNYLSYQRGLMNLHRVTGIPPTVKILDGEVTKLGDLAITGGTYSDVWLGQWLGAEKVALKSLRNIKGSDPKAQKRFTQEVRLWSSIDSHDNVLEFYGVVTNMGHNVHLVSPWQSSGNILDYLVPQKASSIFTLATSFTGTTNILVSAAGNACICDFGMSKVIEDITDRNASATLTTSGSARWLAPELIEDIVPSPTKSTDVYSFAMTILELFTGKHPWADKKRDASVIHDVVVLQLTPPRPCWDNGESVLSDTLWALMQECWCRDATVRPQMAEVAARLRDGTASQS